MRFSPAFLDELRARISLTEVIGRKVRLTRHGAEAHGLCPFHKEKTPSFTVSEDKGFYHCFGCGAHGDAIGFLMQNESLSFTEAVTMLAGEAGLPLPRGEEDRHGETSELARLYIILEAAAQRFEACLMSDHPAAAAARSYLAERGIAPAIQRKFRLGLTPDGSRSLAIQLAKAGFDASSLEKAGLIIQPEDGRPPYDRFRNRLMFPIQDRQGRPIGFGGRILGDGTPKYLNSPETALFHKGRTLYGLSQALPAIRKSGRAILVEGYVDAVMMAQMGFAESLAPLGTAVTEAQLEGLWRLVDEPVLCFDGDSAGRRAALRAAELALPLLKAGKSIQIALLPEAEDPDSFLRSHGPEAMRRILGQALPLARYIWESEASAHPADTPERRAGLRQRLYQRLRTIGDAEVAKLYRQAMDEWFAETFSPRPALSQAAGRESRYRPAGKGIAPFSGGAAARKGVFGLRRHWQELAIAALIHHPELIHRHLEALERLKFPDPELDKIRQHIIELAVSKDGFDSVRLRSALAEKGESGGLAAILSRTAFVGAIRPAAPLDVVERQLEEVLRQLFEDQ